jgi:hypothetical protein
MTGGGRYTIRPVAPEDLTHINALLSQVWFPRRSADGFDWLMARNPGQSGLPPGWVASDETGVQAFLGNFVQRAWRLGEAHLIAAGHSFVARPGRGGLAFGLIRRFLRQPEPLILSGLNSNPVSAELYQAMRLATYADTGSLRLSWVTNAGAVLAGAASWRLHAVTGHRHARRLADIRRPAPGVERILKAHGGDVRRIIDPNGDTRLAAFDLSLRRGARLFTERSPEALAWRLADPESDTPPVLVAYPAEGAIRGLALLQFNKPSEAEPPYLDVTDLVTLDPQDSEAAQALLRAGLALAKRGGAARLRLQMVSRDTLRLIGPLAAAARRSVSAAPHAFYKANPGAPLPVEAYWQPLPYDSDNGPSLRAMPIRRT